MQGGHHAAHDRVASGTRRMRPGAEEERARQPGDERDPDARGHELLDREYSSLSNATRGMKPARAHAESSSRRASEPVGMSTQVSLASSSSPICSRAASGCDAGKHGAQRVLEQRDELRRPSGSAARRRR